MRTELVTAEGTVVSLRPASRDDEDFLHDLYRDRRAPELVGLGWSTDDQRAFLEMQFRAQQEGYGATFPHAAHWLVLVDGQRAGRLLVDHEQDGHRVVDVVILTPYRGRGIGTALMKETVDEARAEGVPVRLTVAAHDERLVRWYRGLGFSIVGEQLPNLRMVWFPPPARDA